MSMICCLLDFPDVHLNELISKPEQIRELIREEDEFITYLDKAWHAIHFVLNREVWTGKEPLCYLITGGKTIGDIDVGYGPARAVKSEQVKAFHDALEAISEDDFTKLFDAKELDKAQVYGSWGKREPEVDLYYVLGHFETLKKFLAEAKTNAVGMIVWLS